MAKNVVVLGMGGIGTVYTYILSKASDVSVSCIARSNYDILSTKGIQLHSGLYGQQTVKPDNVYRSSTEAGEKLGRIDCIIVTTKNLPNAQPSLVETLAPIVKPIDGDRTSTIALIQNGVGIEDPVQSGFPKSTIVSVCAYIGASQTVPGQVEMMAMESLHAGVLQTDEVARTELDGFIAMMRSGGSNTEKAANIEQRRWQKLLWNVGYSTVCTLMGFDTHVIHGIAESRQMVHMAMHETVSVANALGMGLEKDLADRMVDMKGPVPYKPSMQLDRERRDQMEVDVILGHPIQQARRLGLSVPTLDFLYMALTTINKHNQTHR